MKDIESRTDIEHLVDAFYAKVIVDETIGHFFTEVVPIDWDKHMPTMYDFWESMLLGAANYQGNPMQKHIAFSKKEPLKPKHFSQWLSLWEQTINANFEGDKAREAIMRAKSIAGIMEMKTS